MYVCMYAIIHTNKQTHPAAIMEEQLERIRDVQVSNDTYIPSYIHTYPTYPTYLPTNPLTYLPTYLQDHLIFRSITSPTSSSSLLLSELSKLDPPHKLAIQVGR